MKRATITLPDEIEHALDDYRQDQDVGQPLTAIVQTALRQFLATRGYLPPAQPLRITPVSPGSGWTDASVRHDRELAGE